MRLLWLSAENFRSFERLELDLNVDGLIAVVGSNGAGKSTIFGAVEWALYGARGRGTLPVRRDSCSEDQECWVEAHFEVSGRAYAVRRVDGKEATLSDLATGETICTGREGTSRQVATLLGLTRDMFRGTFYARQREVQALDSTDEAKRREQVEMLLGIERLRRAVAHATTSVKEQDHLVKTLAAGAPDVDALKEEAARIEREAQQAAPIVQAAEARVETAKSAREQAKARLDSIRAQESEMTERRARVQAASSAASHEVAARDALRTQVAEAEAAIAELTQLTPVAERIESLTAEEREMDLRRANDERAKELREGQRAALSVAASLSDRLDELVANTAAAGLQLDGVGEPDQDGLIGDEQTLEAQIEEAEEERESLRSKLQDLVVKRREAERKTGELRERIGLGERAAALDSKLVDLPATEQAAEDALNEWYSAQARRTQLDETIAHDTQHREAVLAGETEAACPTCKRPYGVGELEEILAGYDRELHARSQQLADIDAELVELQAAREKTREQADDLRSLAADRRAIEDAPRADALPGLREDVAGSEEEIAQLAEQEAEADSRMSDLTAQLPLLRTRARKAEDARRRFADLAAQRAQAESEARLYGEQLSGVNVNGYDAAAHTALRTELVEAQAASHKCAALRGKVDGLELLRRRLAEQDGKVEAAQGECAKLAEAVAEVAVEEGAVDAAEDACTACDEELDAAHSALIEANRQAASDSEAAAAAHARLQDARERTTQIGEQRRELRVRTEVEKALSAYREDASRQARPALEHETGLLLGKTTRQRYNAVQLSDSYQLEVADGRQLYPLRRFSGGEQDLAGLCLRLALSRTLARQRGAETGFVLLDEVFGSQDLDRRHALLEQLHTIAAGEFRQVFVVSHTEGVVEHCDLAIDVVRNDDGISVAVGPHA